jgi:3-oxoacyl-ACP reductase-like protein
MIFEWILVSIIAYIIYNIHDDIKQGKGEAPTFEDKTVLITGASSGIGRQMALDFNAKGATVITLSL